MSGGVNPLEWLFPPLALSHTIADAAGVNVTTPGSPRAQQQQAESAMRNEERAREAALRREQRLSEQREVQARPENVRRRAAASAASLGETGKRASQFLSGL
jgi:hypothetical protein